MRVGTFIGICIGAFALLAIIIRRAHEYGNPKPQTVEQERERVIIGMIPQHSPGVSVGEWVDEYQIDPAYDAIEAVRSQVG